MQTGPETSSPVEENTSELKYGVMKVAQGLISLEESGDVPTLIALARQLQPINIETVHRWINQAIDTNFVVPQGIKYRLNPNKRIELEKQMEECKSRLEANHQLPIYPNRVRSLFNSSIMRLESDFVNTSKAHVKLCNKLSQTPPIMPPNLELNQKLRICLLKKLAQQKKKSCLESSRFVSFNSPVPNTGVSQQFMSSIQFEKEVNIKRCCSCMHGKTKSSNVIKRGVGKLISARKKSGKCRKRSKSAMNFNKIVTRPQKKSTRRRLNRREKQPKL